MQIATCASLDEAEEFITEADMDYVRVRHTLAPGEKTSLHYHPETTEWFVISDGEFTVQVDDEERTFKTQGGVLVVSLPKGKMHALLAKSNLSYVVFRDKEGETIYCWQEFLSLQYP